MVAGIRSPWGLHQREDQFDDQGQPRHPKEDPQGHCVLVPQWVPPGGVHPWGGGQDQRMKAWESQGHVPKAEMDTQGLRRTSRIWEVQTVLGLLAWWSTLRLQEASLDWYLGFGN